MYLQVGVMKEYMEEVYGERAAFGDKGYREYLQKEVKVLESMLVMSSDN